MENDEMTAQGDRVGVPRKLFLYWHQGFRNAPDMVQRCAETWTVKNPSWEVWLLDRDTIEAHVTIPRPVSKLNLPLPALSDFLRLILLREEGGVWADATTWCVNPLDDWLPELLRPAGFFAFKSAIVAADQVTPLVPWFLAAVPNHRIVEFWHDSAIDLARKGLFFPQSDDPTDKDYLWAHRLFQSCLDSNDEFRDAWSSVPKISAAGPHAVLRFGLLKPASKEVLAHLREKRVGLYKLTRRMAIPSDIRGTVLDALYRSDWGMPAMGGRMS